jgi:O-antigen ligase
MTRAATRTSATATDSSVPDSIAPSVVLPGAVLAITALLASGAPFPVLELMHGEGIWRWHQGLLAILSVLTAWVLVQQKRSGRRVHNAHASISQVVVLLLIVATVFTTQYVPTVAALQRTFLPYVLGFLLVPLLGAKESFRWMLNGFMIGIIFSLVLYLTGDAVGYRDFPFFSGVWISRNSLGHVATLAVALTLCSPLQRAQRVIHTLLSFIALWLSHSKSPFLVLPVVVASLVVIWFVGAIQARSAGDSITVRTLMFRGLATVLTASSAFLIAWFTHPELSGATRQFFTLTERTSLWKAAWAPLMRKPFTGYGLGNVFMESVRPELAPLTKWDSVHLHNGYLDVFAVGGLLLLVPMLALCGLSIFRATTTALSRKTQSWVILVLVVTVLVLNVTEASLLNTVPHTLLMLNCVVLRSKHPYQS